jgi:hypothetical protein
MVSISTYAENVNTLADCYTVCPCYIMLLIYTENADSSFDLLSVMDESV